MQADFDTFWEATVVEPTPDERGLYSIAVAAELSGLGEQTLRLYERKGLLTPARTSGGTRRYSHNDVLLVRRVVELLAEGLNLTGARLSKESVRRGGISSAN